MKQVALIVILLVAMVAARVAPAADFNAAAASTNLANPDAARLLAMEIAARARAHSASQGKFTTTYPRAAAPAAVAAAPAAPAPVCPTPTAEAASTTESGMKFFPIRQGMSPREFKLPHRAQTQATAQALQAATSGNDKARALAETALQASIAPPPDVQAQAEVAAASAPVSPADPNAAAKEAVLREIQRYRSGRGVW